MQKTFKVAQVRSLLNQLDKEQISFSRFVEILNEHADGKRKIDIKPIDDMYNDLKSEVENLQLANVGSSVSLTENQIDELAEIGSQHLYLGEMDEGRISCGGILEQLQNIANSFSVEAGELVAWIGVQAPPKKGRRTRL